MFILQDIYIVGVQNFTVYELYGKLQHLLNNSLLQPLQIILKYHAQRSIFDEIRGVWIADETLSPVFDRPSQLNKNYL